MKDMSEERIELLSHLEVAIEDAWNSGAPEGQDGTLVSRLASEHPQFAEELYVFFAALVTTTLDPDLTRPELAAADHRTREWLEREGFKDVAKAHRESGTITTPPPPPTGGQSVLATLKQRTGKTGETIARMLDITPGFLVGISDNARLVPPTVCREVARRAHVELGIDEQTTIEAFASRVTPKLAASRSAPHKASVVTFDDLVNRSKMTSTQKEFWLRLVRQPEESA